MLEVKILYRPFGIGTGDVLETIQITNRGDHINRPDMGNYRVATKTGDFHIEDHAREDGYLVLLKRIIDKLVEIRSVQEVEAEVIKEFKRVGLKT